MNFKKYHVSKNLFDVNKEWVKQSNTDTVIVSGNSVTITSKYYAKVKMSVPRNTDCVIKANVFEEGVTTAGTVDIYESDGSTRIIYRVISETEDVPFNTGNNDEIWVYLYASNGTEKTKTYSEIMLNTGSSPLPYEPYSSEVWHDTPHYIHNTSTDTITTLPANIYPNDTSITVGVKGQSSQNGTPTPQNPVDVNGTGERTGNLFDDDNVEFGKWVNSNGVIVTNATYAAGCDIKFGTASEIAIKHYGNKPYSYSMAFYDSNGNFLSRVHRSNPSSSYDTIPVPENAVSARFQVAVDTSEVMTSAILKAMELMLNSGSTALPYEPYGYKIPISLSGTTTPIYLGEVQTTRAVKKLVFDGTEEWNKGNYPPSGGYQFFTLKPSDIADNPDWLTTHFKKGSGLNGSAFASYLSLYPEKMILPENATANDFKSWLAQQYANGTPVTVWYVLATPQTAIVNEPLMKIGDYADSLTTSVSCTAGENTLDVQTTVAPSEVSAGFSGWHPVSAAHERSGGAWD